MRRIIYIDNFLAEHGYPPTTGYAMVPLLQKAGYKVVPASNRKKRLSRLLHMLYVIYKWRRNAIVMIAVYSTAAFYFALGCSLFCRWMRLPYIALLHGGNLPDRLQASPLSGRQLFGNSTANVAVSGYLKKALDNQGLPCHVIPNSIQLADYPVVHRATLQPALLWVRSFHAIYCPQMAVRVLHEIRKKYPAATLTMVGPDKDGSLAICKTLACQLGIQHNITFTGRLPKKEWIQLAASHDIFLNTSGIDNLPVSVIEAMALGMVVISTNAGGMPYLLQHEQNGLLVNVDDVEDMTRCIARVLEDSQLAASLSRQARLTAQQYNDETVLALWQELLSTIP